MNTNTATSKRMRRAFPEYTPRARAPGEALPSTENLLERPRYVPPKHESTRAGSQDFMKVRSVGYPT